MNRLDKAGGWAALAMAASYTGGFALLAAMSGRAEVEGGAAQLAFALAHSVTLAAAMIVLFLLFGTALIVLSTALRRRFDAAASGWSEVTCYVGLGWAALVLASGLVGLAGLQSIADLAVAEPDRAATVWTAIAIVQNALGGGIEYVGGVWSLSVGVLTLATRALPRLSGWLAIGIGILGIVTTFPGLGDAAALFGLCQIAWFGWIGYFLVRESRPEAITARA